MAKFDPRAIRLIAISDRHAVGMGSLEQAATSALEAGLPALMLREKDLPEEELLPVARRLRQATARHGALLLLNRRVEIANAVGADGVHLGADGPTIDEARNVLGNTAIIGYSAHDINEALRALDRGCDYVTFSPIFETPSKEGILQPVGLEALAKLAAQAPGRVVALGGISVSNIAEVAATGAAGIAVIRAVFGARHPAEATAELISRWDKSVPSPPEKSASP